VSCLAEQAKILVEEAEENKLGDDACQARWKRWHTCSLCEQRHHGVVACALGWACWKTYVGRPERDLPRHLAMKQLGNGLSAAEHHADALAVKEAQLSMLRRLGAPEEAMLAVQGNLAITYHELGRLDESNRMLRDLYSGRLKLNGVEHEETLRAANNYAESLHCQQRFAEAKTILRITVPVARRVLADNHRLTLRLRMNYAKALYKDPDATLEDLREAVTSLEETERIALRVLGGAHPNVVENEAVLRDSRAALRAREGAASGDVSAIRKAVEALTTGDG
jgi:hypothetical protein